MSRSWCKHTNYVLDQFLEDLLNIGIPSISIVRLGSKSTAATKQLTLFHQSTSYRRDRTTWALTDELKNRAESYHDSLMERIFAFRSFRVKDAVLPDYLEFSEDSEYFDAFTMPDSDDGKTVVGKDGKALGKFYFLQEWAAGGFPSVFQDHAHLFPRVWSMPQARRQSLMAQWYQEILDELISEISTLRRRCDECQRQLAQLYSQKVTSILKEKRIIRVHYYSSGDTHRSIWEAAPDGVLVEEAGEILESHTLTVMTPNTKQLILIGDHKQLRPKVNNYALTIEKGDG